MILDRQRFDATYLVFLLIAGGLVLLPFAPADPPIPWDQWRGPTRDGQIAPGGSLPAELGEDSLRLLWRMPLDKGYSSPIVSADRVFTVETEDGKREVVRSFDRATGKEMWNTKWTGAMSVPLFAWKRGSWVRGTPCLRGDSLYVGGMRDVLSCIDAVTGRERWRVDFMERYESKLPEFGFVSSPLATEDGIYVQAGGSVVKLDPQNGASLWRALEDGGGMWGSAFSSPMLAEIRGKQQLVVQTRTVLAGVDPDSGVVLWSVAVPAYRGMNILNPTIVENQIFTSSYKGGSFLFEVNRDGDTWSVNQVWKNSVEGYMSSPIVLDGHIYLHCRDRKFRCLKWATGTQQWHSPKRFGGYWSMVSDGKRILALDEKGELLLISPDPKEFVLVERRAVSKEDTWAHLAVLGHCLYIRDLKGITAWQWE